MKLTTNLPDMHLAISACLKCNCCSYGVWPQNRTICPLSEQNKCYTYSAGGLLYLAKAVLRGQIEFSQELAELVFTCSSCGACDNKCVIVRSVNPDMALSDIIRLFKSEMVKKGFIPEGPIRNLYEEVQKNGDLNGNAANPLQIPAGVINDGADTLLVAEAIRSENEAKSFEAVLALLVKMDEQVALMIDQGSLGSTLYDFGFWDQLPGLVERKWQKVKQGGDKKLLFLDPHCQEFMTNKYAKILGKSCEFEGQHFSELLVQALENGKLKSKKSGNIKVSYHDPCFLGRGLGIYDAPRRVLQLLDGVELVEMNRHREQSFCCGARGLGNYFADGVKKPAKVRVNEFLDTQADVLITACSHCQVVLGKELGNEKNRVQDLFQFVNERV